LKSPLKIFEKRQHGGCNQELSKLLGGTPYYLRNGLSYELQIL